MIKEDKDKTKSRSMISKIGGWLSSKKTDDDASKIEPKSTEIEHKTKSEEQVAPENAPAPEKTQEKPVARPKKKPQSRPKTTGKTTKSKQASSQESKTQQTKQQSRGPKKAARPTKKQAANDNIIKLLINTEEPEECRVALVENGRVESFHVETVVHAQTKGNIYKGVITAVEPNLQAVFVNIGLDKNGFLPFGDIHPEYYCKEVGENVHWKSLKIEEVIRKGQEVFVEVVKEATGNKGASLTTYLSLPGRYLVLLPGSDSHGISRKIEGEEQRSRLRSIIEGLKRPEGIGYIIRTASKDITKTALTQDMKYLVNLWEEIRRTGQAVDAPALIHKEHNIINRFLRDHFTSEIQEILVDDEEAFKQVERFLDLLPSTQKKTKAKHYKGSRPLFSYNEVEKQIEQIYHPTVQLRSGGSIVINPTEALVAIDVNSGRTGKDKSFDETIFLANKEAAEELARQLRLRDLGGLIVVDFIDMRDKRHIREVEKIVKTSMKRDKAKVDMSRISKFGLLQISRQKMASPIQRGNYMVCEHCKGRGVVRSVETLALAYLRRIQAGVTHRNVIGVECRMPLDVAQYLLNKKRGELGEMETRYKVNIDITADPTMNPTEEDIQFLRSK